MERAFFMMGYAETKVSNYLMKTVSGDARKDGLDNKWLLKVEEGKC